MNDLPPQAANSSVPAQSSTYPRLVAGKIMGAWRYAVLAGMLFGSVLLIEESVFADGPERAAFTQQPGD